MASATETPQQPTSVGNPERTEQRFVDEQIRRTRRALKMVDLVAGCITLVIGVLSYLLTMAVLEHWVVPGGLNPTTRAMLLIVLVAGVLWYSWRYFWPLMSRPINPVYAAHTIEQGSPTLKNSLLNLLLLRSRRRQISRQVYEAIETQAAQRLSQAPLDSAVDRSSILRLGYVLVAVVALCSLYRILSPKDPLASAGRLLMPWANIPVPSRVQILDVQPGDTSVARGEQLTISAEVLGKGEEEPVRLFYSQADGQISNQEVLMTGDEAGLRFTAQVPGRIALGSSGGIQGDLVYHLEAGDARSPDFHVSVFSQPTLVVERIRYEYPLYTRYPPREEAFTGDISGLEGTIVTLYAVANQPIDKAHVDFEADGRHDILMNSEELSASVRFPLEFKEDRRTPKHKSYVLRYTTDEGRTNPSPPKYRIHVERDLSPEIELIEPTEELLDVGLQEEVSIGVEARDPDFALHNLAVLGEVAGERVMKESLLSTDHTGRFSGKLKIVPEELGLREGDVMEYWAAAADNRRPEPNLAFSAHQKIRIVGPGKREGLPDNEQENQPGDGQAGDSAGENGEQGEGQEGEGQEGQSGAGGNQQQDGESQQQGEGGQGQQQNGESGEGEQQSQGGQSGEGEGESQGESGGQSEGEGSSESQQGAQNGESSDSSPSDSQGEPSAGNERVSPDGDNDGEAFDRIAKHLQEKQEEGQNGEGSESGDGQQQQSGDSQGSEGEQSDGEQADGERADGGQEKPEENQNSAGAEQNAAEQQGEESQDQTAAGEGDSDQQGESEGEGGTEQQEQSEGEGSQGEPSPQEQSGSGQQGSEQEQGGNEQGDSPAAEMSQEQGEAGGGDNPGENEGTPNSDGAQKPSDKNSETGAESPTNDQEASAESQSKKESDSEGSQGGDRSGGGQEGAGQQADEEGTGAAGENQSAEDGAGQSSETGEGETGEKPGGEQTAEGETGESSGDQPGEGSEQGDQAGAKPGEGESEGTPKPGESPSDPSESSGGTPEGGGTGSNDSSPPPGGELEPADEANLDYARKQTDLVLDTLEEQLRKKQVDEELLEKLGWTADELKRFVDRWKNLKDQAAGGGPNAQQAQDELDTALRSLGIDPNRRSGFNSRNAKDKLRDLRESFRGRTPLEYQELMRKYVKGTAGADDEE